MIYSKGVASNPPISKIDGFVNTKATITTTKLVREITINLKNEMKFQSAAMHTIQEAIEAYLNNIFENKIMCVLNKN